MREARSSKRKYLPYVAIVLLIVFLLSAVLLFVNLWERFGARSSFQGEEVGPTTLTYNGEEYILKDDEDLEIILLLGLDKFDGDVVDEAADRNDKQSDFMMLLVIDDRNREITAIHINRDTVTEMNKLGISGDVVGTVTQQIALAHTYGDGQKVSCGNSVEAVQKLMYNIKIDHYISVTMDTVPVFNDLVGGVEVEVLDDFTGIDDTLIKGETVTLMGEHALNYVRTRYGLDDSTNETRMIRQRQYIKALYEKTLEKFESDENFIIEATTKIEDSLVTDRSITELQELFRKISDYRFKEIRYIEGESVKGETFIEFTPDEEKLKKLVVEMFYSLKD